MASRLTIGIAAMIALGLCFLSMRDVPHNTAIRSLQPTMTILWVAVALIIVTSLLGARSIRRPLTFTRLKTA